MKYLNDFKMFILRGNVVDLAVGIVIGVAFGGVVTAFVTDLLTPLISIPGKVSFAAYSFQIGGGTFLIGAFLNALLSFVLIAAAVFFFVVKPVNAMMMRRKQEAPPDPTTRDCPYCLSTIPIKASRCAFCTQEVAPQPMEAAPA